MSYASCKTNKQTIVIDPIPRHFHSELCITTPTRLPNRDTCKRPLSSENKHSREEREMQKNTSLDKKHFQEECEMQETTSLENKHFQEEREMQETTYSSKTKHSQEECEKQKTTSLENKHFQEECEMRETFTPHFFFKISRRMRSARDL
jgi:hypothetical protein